MNICGFAIYLFVSGESILEDNQIAEFYPETDIFELNVDIHFQGVILTKYEYQNKLILKEFLQ